MLAANVIQVSTAADTLEALTLADPSDEPTRLNAIANLRAAVQRTIAEIKAMAEPNAPFSMMVSKWIQQFRDDMC